MSTKRHSDSFTDTYFKIKDKYFTGKTNITDLQLY